MQDLGIRVLFMGDNFARLLSGLWVTVRISLISVVLSIILGVLLGMVMTIKNPVTKALTKIYLEFVRIMPQLVLLFLVYFGLTKSFGINLSGEASSIIVFTIWGTAEMGDLVRGALISIPKHQYESGEAIGLNKIQIYRYIMIKTTSLIVLIGVVEVMKVAQQIIEANRYSAPDAALWIYGTIFFLYFIVCWPISLLAGRLEKKWKD